MRESITEKKKCGEIPLPNGFFVCVDFSHDYLRLFIAKARGGVSVILREKITAQ